MENCMLVGINFCITGSSQIYKQWSCEPLKIRIFIKRNVQYLHIHTLVYDLCFELS